VARKPTPCLSIPFTLALGSTDFSGVIGLRGTGVPIVRTMGDFTGAVVSGVSTVLTMGVDSPTGLTVGLGTPTGFGAGVGTPTGFGVGLCFFVTGGSIGVGFFAWERRVRVDV
jgi:hypothetical protein